MSEIQTTPARIREHLHVSYLQLQSLLHDELSTFPTPLLYQSSSPDEWTIMQNLAHIVEFLPYWAKEIEKLLASPGQPFGRTHTDRARLQAIEDHRHDTLAQIEELLPLSYARIDAVLANLREEDLHLHGVHVKYGERTLDWFIHEFLTTHLDAHLQQLQSIHPQTP